MSKFNKSVKAIVKELLSTEDLDTFVDVSTETPESGEVLKWNAITNKWTPSADVSGSGAGGHTIQNAGNNLTGRTYLNFTGSGVTATDDSGNDTTKVTINVGEGSGESNTTSNEGAGIGLALPKENYNLPLKTFVAGSNISLVTGSNTITIAYKPPDVDNGAASDPNFMAGIRVMSDNSVSIAAGGVSRLFISGSGYIGINVTGSDITHRLTLPNSSTGNDGKAVAYGWSTYSSHRYKTDVQTIFNPVEIVKELRGVRYAWKDSGRSDIGFIAEEVGKILPELVEYETNGIDAKSMNYAKLTSILVEAIKLQQRQIDELFKLIK